MNNISRDIEMNNISRNIELTNAQTVYNTGINATRVILNTSLDLARRKKNIRDKILLVILLLIILSFIIACIFIMLTDNSYTNDVVKGYLILYFILIISTIINIIKNNNEFEIIKSISLILNITIFIYFIIAYLSEHPHCYNAQCDTYVSKQEKHHVGHDCHRVGKRTVCNTSDDYITYHRTRHHNNNHHGVKYNNIKYIDWKVWKFLLISGFTNIFILFPINLSTILKY